MVRSASSSLSSRWRRRSLRRPLKRVLQTLVAVVLIAPSVGLWATVSSAAVPADAFEITDANIVDDVSTAPHDWASLFTSTGAPTDIGGFLARSFVADPISSDPLPSPPCDAGTKGDPTTMVSSGSDKNGDPIDTLRFNPNSVPNKDDITNTYAAARLVPQDAPSTAVDTVFYFALERAESNGDAHIDFEFLREPATLEVTGSDAATGCDIGHWVGTRSAGDILVSMNFTQGGVLGTLEVRIWVGDAVTGSYVEQTLPTGSVGFVTNTAAIDCGDWECRDSSGASQSQLDPSAFVEGYLNVSAVLGRAAVGCYSTFVAQNRSSQSFESELKDFALGAFDTCDARISLRPSGLNEVGTTHTMTAKVETNEAGTFTPSEGATVNGTTTLGSFVGGSSCLTNASGECNLTITSTTSGTATVNVSTTVAVAEGRDAFRSTAANSGSGGSGPATKHWVDGAISMVRTATNEVNHAHEFTVTVTPLAPADVNVSNVSITPSVTPTPAIAPTTTCGASVAVSGGVATCTYTVNNLTAGVFDVDASTIIRYSWATFTEEVSRSTTGNAGPAGNTGATKTFVDASVAITGTATNNVNDAHVFNVTATAIPAGAATVVFDSITTTLTPVPGTVATTCDRPNIEANTATCTLTINSDVGGVFVANATARLTVGGVAIVRSTDVSIAPAGPSGSGPATKTYVAPAAVLGAVLTRTEPLPTTGLDPTPAIALSLLLITGGRLLVIATRRRRIVRT